MHKLVVFVDDNVSVTRHGKHLYCVDVADIWKSGSLQRAHKCRLDSVGEFEILDGLSRGVSGNLQTWYERPKKALDAKTRTGK
jgi:hypothetical protein